MISKSDFDFYKENGYLVIQNFLDDKKVDKLKANYDDLRKKLAERTSIKYSDYHKEISQIRDIWKYDEDFKKLILEGEIAKTAPLFFEDKSCRLLHDHIINKPLGNNGTVPWHQDYTYWPTDNPNGLSFWLPLSDLDKNAGVLEVVPKSHLWGEEKPVDFINDTKDFSNYDVKYLEVKKGDIVILDALTWHRTSENISIEERIAYISLWIPANSRYAPKHASWHPVNDNITVKENEILNDDWFPVIGKGKTNGPEHTYLDNSETETMQKITMYNASKKARNFLQKHLDINTDVWTFLYNETNREKAVNRLIEKFNLNDNVSDELNEVLLSMSINGLAYQNHKARNVYNKSYVKFKNIFKDEI